MFRATLGAKGGLNSKLHAVVNDDGKPVVMTLTAGQTSDHIGAKLMYPYSPKARILIGDKGYDSDDYRAGLKAKCIEACIPPRKGHKNPQSYCKTSYKQRHKVENAYNRPKDCRWIATRYDRPMQ